MNLICDPDIIEAVDTAVTVSFAWTASGIDIGLAKWIYIRVQVPQKHLFALQLSLPEISVLLSGSCCAFRKIVS